MVRTTRRALSNHVLARAHLMFVALVVSVAVLLAGCGGLAVHESRVLRAGQVDIKLPEGFKVVGSKVVAPPHETSPASTAATKTTGESSPGSTLPGQTVPGKAATATTTVGTTIPLKSSEDAQTQMFQAMGKFRACLDEFGVKFIGAPDRSNPQSPTNDPDYIKNLSTCAARSGIVQALQKVQSANANLTPEQIKEQNKSYLKWRSCMIGKGWKIPEPKPDAEGRLFSFGAAASGGSGGATSQITPPAGKDLLTSKDLSQCVEKIQKSTKKKSSK